MQISGETTRIRQPKPEREAARLAATFPPPTISTSRSFRFTNSGKYAISVFSLSVRVFPFPFPFLKIQIGEAVSGVSMISGYGTGHGQGI